MNQIARCDLLPEREDGAILSARVYSPCPARKTSPKAKIINSSWHLGTNFSLSKRTATFNVQSRIRKNVQHNNILIK